MGFHHCFVAVRAHISARPFPIVSLYNVQDIVIAIRSLFLRS